MLRRARRQWVFSLLNVLGLALGMAAGYIIMQYVLYEQQYDRFYAQRDQLYRVVDVAGPRLEHRAQVIPLLGPWLEQEFPEVVQTVRLHPSRGTVQTSAQPKDVQSFTLDEIFFCDPEIFDFLGFSLAQGNPETALNTPNGMVISASLAKKMFGRQNPMGKQLIYYDYNFGKLTCEVTGVLQDIPRQSHLQMQALLPVASTQIQPPSWAQLDGFNWNAFFVYVRLQAGTDVDQLEESMQEHIQKITETMDANEEEPQFALQALKNIHLHSYYQADVANQGNYREIQFMQTIAGLILVIAWLNYINLATARSGERAREVGVRKLIGAQKNQLVYQFLGESLILNLVALGIALLLVELGRSYLVAWLNLPGEIFTQVSLEMILGSLTFVFLGSVLAGYYPAWVLSRFPVVEVLKGGNTKPKGKQNLRRVLVALQFAVSISLMMGAYTNYRQVNYLLSKDLGIRIDNILVIPEPQIQDSLFRQKSQSFKNALQEIPEIKTVSFTGHVPGTGYNWGSDQFKRTEQNLESYPFIHVNYIDGNYVKTFANTLLAQSDNLRPGNEKSLYTGNKKILINERVRKAYGFKSNEAALGEVLLNFDQGYEIVGVVQDYHHQSLREVIDPVIFIFRENGGYCAIGFQEIKEGSMTLVQAKYQEAYPGNPWEAFLLEDTMRDLYQNDQRLGRIFSLFTFLAIFIACLGLFGLASFTAEQRSKEISIRKVLGASQPSILKLLLREYFYIFLLSSAVALPFAYFLIREWLSNYAYRIEPGIGFFLIPWLGGLLAALLSVSFQTYKAIRRSPARNLRYE